MEPKTIQSFLARYTARIKAPEKSVLDAFKNAVREAASFELDAGDASYRPHTRTITLGCRGPKKTEILLRKGTILSKMKQALPPQSAPMDIV